MKDFIQKQFGKYNLPRKFILLSDLSVTAMALLPAYLLRLNFNINQLSFSELFFQQVLIILPVYGVAFLWSGSYRGIIRHSGIEDASRFAVVITLSTLVILLISQMARNYLSFQTLVIPNSVIVIHGALISILLLGFRLVVRSIYYTYGISRTEYRKVLIFGAGAMGQMTRQVLENDRNKHTLVTGFIDDCDNLIGKRLADKLIYSEDQAFAKFIESKNVNEIILAVAPHLIKNSRKKKLFDRCLEHNVSIREVQPVEYWIDGKLSTKQIRDVNIEDLLGRDPIWLNQDNVSKGLKNTVVLVTGAAGSIGSEIVRQLMKFESSQVILLDQAETPLYDLQNDLLRVFPYSRFEVVVGNVTDYCRMHSIFEKYRPQYVFNAAAYKHVPLMEATPYEAIRVNVGGTRLLADLSVEFGVKKFVMISTDKAVNPTNIMGASKRICEIYIQALTQSDHIPTQFITTRFGNVLGSNGSVVPLFRKQIEAGGPVTVTHPDIIRYFMTIPEACQLVLEAGFMGRGGEIYVFDMGDPVRIYDLAVKMISLAGLKPEIDIPILFTGLRPGEKLFEELLADEENTIPTHHPKIKTAKVREHNFDIVKLAVDELLNAIQIESEKEMVLRMKNLVPEFISQNSKYCKYDEITV